MIDIQNLTKQFGKTQVLQGITAHIEKGEAVTIIGPSGSGKSTFLRCLNLLETPCSGTISISGIDLMDRKTDINQIRQKIGMVFQHFNLFPHMTVLQNIVFSPVRIKKVPPQIATEKAHHLLDQVGLADKANSYPTRLSGGQKQRAAIARSLAMEPEIMLFDEPTSALDPEMVKEVLHVILELAKSKMTMMIVTHEMRFARLVANTVYFMDEGQIIEKGKPESFFSAPKSDRASFFLAQIL